MLVGSTIGSGIFRVMGGESGIAARAGTGIVVEIGDGNEAGSTSTGSTESRPASIPAKKNGH